MSHDWIIYLAWIFPLLLGVRLVQVIGRLLGRPIERVFPLVLAVGSMAILLQIPIRGLAIGQWILTLNANFSVPLIVLTAQGVWEACPRQPCWRRTDWRSAWSFGLVAGTALYPLALGLTRLDPYASGWGAGPFLGLTVGLAMLLCATGNRFGPVLVLSVAAWQCRLLESTNLWDYLVDPFYAVGSFVMLMREAVRRFRQPSQTHKPAPAIQTTRPGSEIPRYIPATIAGVFHS